MTKKERFRLTISQLRSLHGMHEAEGNGLEKAIAEWKKIVAKHKSSREEVANDEVYDLASEEFDQWCRASMKGAMKFSGEGSERRAYVSNDGRCLKVVLDSSGLMQMKSEIKLFKGNQHECFCKMFDYVKDMTYDVLVTAAVVTDSYFNKAAGISCDAAVELLKRCADEYRGNLDKAIASINNRICKIFLQKVKAQKTLQFKIFKEVLDMYVKFATNPRSNVELMDIDNAENWGIVSRNGQEVMVIIDAGL